MSAAPADSEYVSAPSLAKRLGVSEHVIRRLVNDRWLPSVRVGLQHRIPKAAAEAYIEQHTTAARANAVGYPCASAAGGRCLCKCHTLRTVLQKRRKTSIDAWRQPHDEFIIDLARQGEQVAVIAERVSERFGWPRTEDAVRRRLVQIGHSLRDGWWSRSDVWKVLGLTEAKLRTIEQRGLLSLTEYGKWRRITDDELRRFVKAHAGILFDPRRVRDPKLRSLAETAAIVNRRRQAS